ncbi:MAG TPA: hypothetical protein VE975_08495, partial [Actinomycetota bacterium]|nr:hypothetical protein [Actinomycetota bacterium]
DLNPPSPQFSIAHWFSSPAAQSMAVTRPSLAHGIPGACSDYGTVPGVFSYGRCGVSLWEPD